MADEWRDVVLRTIRETASKNREGSGFGLWIVMKLKNDAFYNVTVRSGSYYTDKVTGEKRIPREGLTDYDFAALKKVWATDVLPLIDHNNPPPVPGPADEPPKEEEDPEKVPW